jgi:LPXTG-site transpeptidase (sortase) family protein
MGLAWVMVGAGAAGVAYPATAHAAGSLRQHRLAEEIGVLLGPGAQVAGARATPRHAPEGGGVQAKGESEPVAVDGQALGVIEIPSIGLDAVFLEGVSAQGLLTGPGHLPWTALPGSDGVAVLAAHRDLHFRHLKEVTLGARVTLRLPTGAISYRVVEFRVAGAHSRWVSEQSGGPLLRLVTCWPPNWAGPAPDRLVVSAVPVAGAIAQRAAAVPGGDPTGRVRSPASASHPLTAAEGGSSSSRVLLASGVGELLPPGVEPFAGALGGTLIGFGLFGAFRTRRRYPWWLAGATAGSVLVAIALFAAWTGPRLVGL